MKATLRTCDRLTSTTQHSAFTDICSWQGRYVCAYRVARSHNIVPKGDIHLRCRSIRSRQWPVTTLTHPYGDLRDPKFLVADDVLYLLCGVYLPNPAHRQHGDAVSNYSGDNILQTHLAWTTDGEHWSDLIPIMRPNYWGWSGACIPATRNRHRPPARARSAAGLWIIASYHTGSGNDPASIVLWGGESLTQHVGIVATIYDGASLERESNTARYPRISPSEPVLWYDQDTELLGCVLRNEHDLLTLGVGKWPYGTADWRWHETTVRMHPSAVIHTEHGWLLAGRQIDYISRKQGERKPVKPRAETSTALYALDGHEVTPLLTLPSSGDTGYAGLCQGPEDHTVLMSFYSQHEVPTGVPGAAVYVATLELQR